MKQIPAKHPTHLEAKGGETIAFCPETQSWWPKGNSPPNAVLTTVAVLLAPALFEPKIGLRTRDIQFRVLEDDEKDTELVTE